MLLRTCLKLGRLLIFEQVDLVHEDDVRLVELPGDDVGRRRVRAVEDCPKALGICEDGERREVDDLRVFILCRLHDGSGQVGAAADWLGEGDVAVRFLGQIVDRIGKARIVAAKAAPRNLPDLVFSVGENRRVDEVGRLVVRNEADRLALPLQNLRGPCHERRLSRA